MNHEDLAREEQPVEGSTDRVFGLVFAAVFAIVAAWPLLSGRPLRGWASALAMAFVLVAMLAPTWLAVPNRWWARLGVAMGKVLNPLTLGLLFYFVIVPVGVLLRVTGKDLLRLKRDKTCPSYWIARDPPGPAPNSMDRQF